MHRKTKTILIMFSMICALAVWIAWGNTALETTPILFAGDEIPQSFDGFRIAHVSDLHDAELGENHGDIVKAIKAAEPDIIVITGDFVDSRRTDISKAVRFAEQAAGIAPTYYVNGNHEALISRQMYTQLADSLRKAGVTVLEDECVSINRDADEIHLIGLNDIGHIQAKGIDGKIQKMQETLQSLMSGNSAFTLVLSHRPELFDAYVDCKPDLVLSGHAHGGQFRLPIVGGLIAPGQGLFPEYDSGLHRKNNTAMIVSRGIGNSIVPVRFNNRPELIVIELQSVK